MVGKEPKVALLPMPKAGDTVPASAQNQRFTRFMARRPLLAALVQSPTFSALRGRQYKNTLCALQKLPFWVPLPGVTTFT